jgi:small subunit ribosomal protein S10
MALANKMMLSSGVREVAGATRVANTCRRLPNRAGNLRVAAFERRDARNGTTQGNSRGNVLSLAAAAPDTAELETERSQLRIKLKCYSHEPLQEAVEAILDVAFRTGCDKTGPAYLPTRRRKYTILKSPHVNKDSREQFEIRIHQRVIDLKNVSAQTIDGLMALDLPAGVDVEVKL